MICTQKNDRFTVNDTFLGNGDLNYPIGLLTADEAAVAGLVRGVENSTNYLYTNQNFWLLSPARFSTFTARQFYLSSKAQIDVFNGGAYGVRGVLNLIPETTVTGTGSELDQFIVQ